MATTATSVGSSGTITKPVAKVPDEAAGGRPRRQPADDGAGRVEVAQLHPRHGRRHGAEHGGGREEGDRRDQGGGRAGVLLQRAAEAARDRHRRDRQRPAGGEQPGQQPPRVELVGGAPADRRAGGDAGQHGADDHRGRLDRQADVRREQPDAEDLQHQDRAGGDEDEGGRATHGRDPRCASRSRGGSQSPRSITRIVWCCCSIVCSAASTERCSSVSTPSSPWTEAPTIATPEHSATAKIDRVVRLPMASQSSGPTLREGKRQRRFLKRAAGTSAATAARRPRRAAARRRRRPRVISRGSRSVATCEPSRS